MVRRSRITVLSIAHLTVVAALTGCTITSADGIANPKSRTRVAGYFARVDRAGDGIAIIVENSLKSDLPIRCYLSNDVENKAEALEPGAPITVDGIVRITDDANYPITIEDCSIK